MHTKWTKPQILVTGGAGYIGSHTAQKLLDRNFDVIVFDNLSTGFKEAIPSGARYVAGDVRNAALLESVLKESKIEAVIHFAAKLNVAESLEKPLEYYENNTLGVLSLVQACTRARVNKVVFSSTAAVYGDETQSGIIKETDGICPLNPYGSSKYFSEQILRDQGVAGGLRSVTLRYFNVAGASEDGLNGQRTANAYHLVHLASQAAVGLRPYLSVFGEDYDSRDGTCIRDYIHVEDLADIHILALNYLLNGGVTDVFNCGYGQGTSVLEVIEAMKKVSGKNFEVRSAPRRPGDAISLVADSSKLKRILGWQPQRNDIEKICKTAYLWEQKRVEENLR